MGQARRRGAAPVATPTRWQARPIGRVHSCFKERFGIPRQAGLIPEAEALLELLPPYNRPEAVRGLGDFSHLWLIFLFHDLPTPGFRPMVRPPRLGGNRRIGIFASRSPFRPNPIGLSAVRLLGIDKGPGRLSLRLGGVDLLDGTPVIDIKPYLPYADRILDASGGFAPIPPGVPRAVRYGPTAAAFLATLPSAEAERLCALVAGVLAQDPRPPYLAQGAAMGREHGMRLLGYDLRWHYETEGARVTAVIPLGDG
jgi:tRNA (adenine37-N6)-methyltransferase